MAAMVKCTHVDGDTIHVNFDHVYQVRRITPGRDDKKPYTELALNTPEPRTIRVSDDPESLARSANDLR